MLGQKKRSTGCDSNHWIEQRDADTPQCHPGDHCHNCKKSGIPREICVRERFADAAVFSKCKNLLAGFRIHTDMNKGEDRVYDAQLAWQNLTWGSTSKTVELRHLRNGPSIIMKCHWFTPNLSDETTLFWKAKEGWRAIKTTAFGLEDPVKNLDLYVSQCAMFYRDSLPQHLGYIGVMLAAMKACPQVRPARLSLCRPIPLT